MMNEPTRARAIPVNDLQACIAKIYGDTAAQHMVISEVRNSVRRYRILSTCCCSSGTAMRI